MIGENKAIVADMPGVTRDRQFGVITWNNQKASVVDTGGIGELTQAIDKEVTKQSQQAVLDADILLFVVDARSGITPIDHELIKSLRKQNKPILLVVNKVDGINPETVQAEFGHLFKHVFYISAIQNKGVTDLLDHIFESFTFEETIEEEHALPKVAVIGRPNVGKSTLVNRLLGEERVLAADMPGVTRDSIYIPLRRYDKDYTLIDTCGMRRKGRVEEGVEYFSVGKSLLAIQDANVVMMILDANEGITDQDLALIDYAIEQGRSTILLVNKWDNLSSDDRKRFEDQIAYRLKFVDYLPIFFISALKGTGVSSLFTAIDKVYRSATLEPTTNQISDILAKATSMHPPPTVRGRRIKLKMAHLGGQNPPTIIIHGNQTNELPQSYIKYLSRTYIKALKLIGTPVRIILKSSDNPFKDKRNLLTPRQIYKKKRLMKHVKS